MTNSRHPSARERSCGRSIAVHGLIGQANVSACRSVDLLTNADPDAVKGARELQRVRCPASIPILATGLCPWALQGLDARAKRIATSTGQSSNAGGPRSGPLGVTAGETAHQFITRHHSSHTTRNAAVNPPANISARVMANPVGV